MIDADNHKLIYHPKRIAEWEQNGDCFPIYVEIGLTNRCNHRCIFCALDYLERGVKDINSKVLEENLEDMASHGVKSVMFAGEGEPLLHKDISYFVEIAKKNKMDVAITTNGVGFTKELADKIIPYLSWIRFSLDAGTSKTYSKIHGTTEKDFEKVLQNIKYVTRIKKKNNYSLEVGVQSLLTYLNLNETIFMTELMKEIGVDNVQIKPYSPHPLSKNDLRFNYGEAEKIREGLESLSTKKFQVVYRKNTIKRLNEERSYPECYGLSFFSLIDAFGNVIPCNLFYKKEEFIYGNINEEKFSEIWKGERRKGIIKKIKNNGVGECRKGCRLDVINRYLERLKNPHPHDNFI